VTLPPTQPASDKHVNFTLGMVLGVSDFAQEFTYHHERDKWLARDLHGSGTVRGLGLSVPTPYPSDGPEVVVQPGVAVTPQGEIVRVPSAQCAKLQAWVTANAAAIGNAVLGSPLHSPAAPGRGALTLYVVLRYKDCLTDLVPIPGEPCRSEDDAMAPSRVKDDFRLDLCLTSPSPPEGEENGMRAVLRWLAQIPVVSGLGSTADALRSAMHAAFGPGSPLSSPLGVYPPPPPTLVINAAGATDMYRAALQYYATDLRDLIAGSTTADAAPVQPGILLGNVTLNVFQDLTGQWHVDPSVAIVVDPTRPFLLPVDMIKEALILAAGEAAMLAPAGTSLFPQASVPAYRLVAAGRVVVKTSAATPNPPGTLPPFPPNLTALWNGSDVNVSFSDLAASTPGLQYIVKVHPYLAAPSPPVIAVGLLVRSISTSPPGFTLHVTANGADATSANFTPNPLQLMVEVSGFVAQGGG
jgi:hypothetical protein